eukprot:TRINITY_DN1420_c1_g1_i13.p1 TRINITY_DN1420_c1_g1~~TRINITY_DN1420_c1_g1_i13.p1  ORF type:complete len:268 (+),score=-15.48 TRINITY_DN1420_c1_g1_i13:1449-2252(+)
MFISSIAAIINDYVYITSLIDYYQINYLRIIIELPPLMRMQCSVRTNLTFQTQCQNVKRKKQMQSQCVYTDVYIYVQVYLSVHVHNFEKSFSVRIQREKYGNVLWRFMARWQQDKKNRNCHSQEERFIRVQFFLSQSHSNQILKQYLLLNIQRIGISTKIQLPSFVLFIWQRYDKNVYLTQDTHVEDVKYVGFESSWQNFTKKYFHREKQIFAKVIVYLYNDCNSQFQWFVNQSGLLKNCHQRYFNVLIQSYCTIRLLHKRIVTKTK